MRLDGPLLPDSSTSNQWRFQTKDWKPITSYKVDMVPLVGLYADNRVICDLNLSVVQTLII